MKTKSTLTVLSLLLGFTSLLQAQQFEISPFYGYRFGGGVENSVTGKTYSFQDSPAYGLMLDYGLDQNGYEKIELYWSHQDTKINLDGFSGIGTVNLSIDEIMLGGVMQANSGRLRPYFSAHAGATHFSPEGYDTDTRFGFALGGGLNVVLTRNISLRGDLRGFCTLVDSSSSFISHNGNTVVVFEGSSMWQGQASAGITIAF